MTNRKSLESFTAVDFAGLIDKVVVFETGSTVLGESPDDVVSLSGRVALIEETGTEVLVTMHGSETSGVVYVLQRADLHDEFVTVVS